MSIWKQRNETGWYDVRSILGHRLGKDAQTSPACLKSLGLQNNIDISLLSSHSLTLYYIVCHFNNYITFKASFKRQIYPGKLGDYGSFIQLINLSKFLFITFSSFRSIEFRNVSFGWRCGREAENFIILESRSEKKKFFLSFPSTEGFMETPYFPNSAGQFNPYWVLAML